ncbi:MAG TPA: hypothetical protein VJ697_05965 [Nitrososphaeraceae archaeon]|nr:hypothetical protein [Nitrososphaeraceae archaeon]
MFVNVNCVALDINNFPSGLPVADVASEVQTSVWDNGIDGSSRLNIRLFSL